MDMIIKTLKKALVAAACAGLAVSVSCTSKHARVDKGGAPVEKKAPIVQTHVDSVPSFPPVIPVIPPATDEDMGFADGLTKIEFEMLEDGDATLFKRDYELDPADPISGGRAKIYLYRGFMDDAVAEMVRIDPFGAGLPGRGLFTVTDSTHRRLELTLAGRVSRGNGRRATALDFVELWSRFIKSRPAQGLAMFRSVQGVEPYINGKNPLVNGFNAADENTVRIRFEKPDPLAFHRMNSSKLIGGPFMLGAYYPAGASGAEMRLLPNKNSTSDTAFLEECVVQMGGDPNPLMSFSTGQYAAMTLYLASDLEIARNELVGDGKASLRRLPSDRYFLACKAEDAQARKFVHGAVNGTDILKNHVMAEGGEIRCVTEQSEPANFPPKSRTPVPVLPKAFKIIYRDDDPVSKIVAKKLSADLNDVGMIAETAPQNPENYEIALVRGAYDCAVGWVQETVLESFTEQLHLASMWFDGEINSQIRLREHKEIPLFSVDNYILLRDDARLHRGKISGIWVDPGR